MKKTPTQEEQSQTHRTEEAGETYEWPSFPPDLMELANILAKKRQTRAEQLAEADAIYEWLILQRGFADDLIRASTKSIRDKEEAADARLDLYGMVRKLAAAAEPRSPKAIWQNYQRHFTGDQKRKVFFAKLRKLTRRVASAGLVNIWELRRKSQDHTNPAREWDRSLLPESIAPHVLRLAILHPGLLEDFLPQFFFRASDCLARESTYRRAILILNGVPWHGWSAEKHATKLIELGSIKPSEAGSEVERIKKFIRDLRRRHKKHIALMAEQTPS